MSAAYIASLKTSSLRAQQPKVDASFLRERYLNSKVKYAPDKPSPPPVGVRGAVDDVSFLKQEVADLKAAFSSFIFVPPTTAPASPTAAAVAPPPPPAAPLVPPTTMIAAVAHTDGDEEALPHTKAKPKKRQTKRKYTSSSGNGRRRKSTVYDYEDEANTSLPAFMMV